MEWMPIEVPRGALAIDFPLRRAPTFTAQVVVPRDMSKEEAARLCEFVRSLALPEPPKGA